MVSTLFAHLLGDAEMAALMGDEAAISAMLRAEAALSRAQGRLGIIPEDAATAIASAAESLRPDPLGLAAGVARAGITAQPVITALKQAAGDHAGWVHYGATSQDIVDTGLMIQLSQALALLRSRLSGLSDLLGTKAREYADLAIPAHTRFQIAAPTTLGAKIAVWRAPLTRQLQRLDELLPRLLNLSLYGAAGTSAALGPRVSEVRQIMADDLDLAAPDIPWHSTRDLIAELGGWLSLTTGALGKMGADLVLLGQSELAQVTAGTGGASSTMPQKSNPVAAETLVTLARLNAGDLGELHQAMIHAYERDGATLEMEWAVLPAMLERTAASLRIGLDLAQTVRANPDRIAEAFSADRGMMMAEAAGFLLAQDMPRSEALKIVARALSEMQKDQSLTLDAALERIAPGRDWQAELAPESNLGAAPAIARAAGD
ncbi:3-carboxy-cis,cis-muconate cycloisomerase [Paracoccus aurantiacus]|uniref:3-carboxy-cis,cis-muconate cycloisomerase n=1 Tax=Paracoccus aurantiacus TaxID=2599412 RepID=A0A5C6S2H8_9RHOB|nr:lyase family protein [Paracoccus aurantiacus]TXB68139.1 3-carboxy-cis,cis-muconate cycloisomerase [Paracoccus aurantiacus]